MVYHARKQLLRYFSEMSVFPLLRVVSMVLFRAMLVFYAMLAGELPYAILAQTMQC